MAMTAARIKAKKARQAHNARDRALSAVVKVGGGRGFIVESSGRFGRRDRTIITAGHCLPGVPPCHGSSFTTERTYPKLLARLGEQPSVCCECLFIDPVADVAILGSPDTQAAPLGAATSGQRQLATARPSGACPNRCLKAEASSNVRKQYLTVFAGRSTYISHSNAQSSSQSSTSITPSSNDSATWYGRSLLISKITFMCP